MAPGVFYDGTVYIVQDNHRCAAEVEKTIFHEMFGHAAVRTLFNNDYDGHLNTLLTRIGGGEGLRTLAIKNNIDLSKYVAGLQADLSLSDAKKVGRADGRAAGALGRTGAIVQKTPCAGSWAPCATCCAVSVWPSWPRTTKPTWRICSASGKVTGQWRQHSRLGRSGTLCRHRKGGSVAGPWQRAGSLADEIGTGIGLGRDHHEHRPGQVRRQAR